MYARCQGGARRKGEIAMRELVDEDGTRLYTIGQMAQLNRVSEKALRLYQSKGILEPAKTDPQTGYRYYILAQCATLDMIQQLSILGFSLNQIAKTLADRDVVSLRDQVREHAEQIEDRMGELKMAHQVSGDILRSCETYLNKPPFGAISLEAIPERHILEFELACSEASPENRGIDAIQKWELDLRHVRQQICDQGWPVSLFRNVGCVISQSDLAARRIRYSRAFVFVTPAFGEDIYARSRSIPAGCYLVKYNDGIFTDDGRERENVDLLKMFDECDRRGMEPAGDYIGEVIADGPAFLFEGREMFYRMCLPVRFKGQSGWRPVSQHDAMSCWRETGRLSH